MLSDEERERIAELYHEEGWNKNKIASEMDISWDTVNRVLGDDEEEDKPEELVQRYRQQSKYKGAKATIESMIEKVKAKGKEEEGYLQAKHQLFVEKAEWLKENMGPENVEEGEEIVEELKKDFEELMDEKDPQTQYEETKRELERVQSEYRETRKMVEEFEEEKGKTLQEMQHFVEEYRDLTANWKALKKEVGQFEDLLEAKSEGFVKGMKKREIWYYCSICREKIVIRPNSSVHQFIMDVLEEEGWGHADCVGRR